MLARKYILSLFHCLQLSWQSSRKYTAVRLLMVAAAFPSALVNRKYTKVLYEFSLSQAGNERKKDYLFWLSSTREYAQSVRLYGIGPMLKARYQAIWQEIFSKKQKMACSRMLLTILFELLPHAVILGVTLHISFGVLNGAATIGDYSHSD